MQGYINRVSLTSKMLIITVFVGAAVWAASDFILSDNIRLIVNKQLDKTLSRQAKEDYEAFEDYMDHYSQLAKLSVKGSNFQRYINNLREYPAEVKYYDDAPDWFLENSLLRMFSYVQYALIFDFRYDVKEVYQAPGEPAPKGLLKMMPLQIDSSTMQNIIMTIENKQYVFASLRFESQNGKITGILMVAAELNSDLLSYVKFNNEDSIAALTGNSSGLKEPQIITSNNPGLVPAGTTYKSLEKDFVIIGKKFLDNAAIDKFGLISLISKKDYRQMTNDILSKERYYRAVTAVSIILAVMLIMLWLTRRIRRLRYRVEEFSRRSLGKKAVGLKKGDAIYILEQRFQSLSSNVMTRTTELNEAVMELAVTLRRAKKMQEDLLKAERFASIGHISGIMAHEMFNPINSVAIRTQKGIGRIVQTSTLLKKLLGEIESLNSFIQGAEKTSAADVETYQRSIAAIVRIANILLMEQEERNGDLNFINDTIAAVITTISNLQQISSMEKHIEPIDIPAMIREIIDDMYEEIKERGIDITASLPKAPSVMMDKTDIYTIVSHVIKNAAESIEKNTQPNAGQIRVELLVKHDAISALDRDTGKVLKQDAIVILVKDTGVGIPSQLWQTIFEQGMVGESRRRMSLSIIRKIIRYYFGDISVTSSTVGVGSEFQVIIPCKPV
ncbi:MAG: HAMP domain-containing histidine kinase [Candidatus Magnetominusculus sp. LBB02]|nr:HAMP domain-containing histidine kinase [Candidatus Magnetominusculus sp. LBB02]